ncbi:hypothetical protein CALVIDRAFT_598197 [Calocera viscosa TUFC12733]|uniref:SigF-like NTF2-like domain-containing protein n=1 Tax=Calocera viscosa (strain TUFC12733) TaxID=1330018 RepID=A0A167MEI7_CALVF|nr:hypothetical protein CALVIDRAFT_598197 [Calocera viscosa TUFC12733]
MDDPQHDLPEVVTLLTTASTPEVQQAAIGRFFAPDAGLNHPLCKVERAPGSRDIILGIYQWYRILSPVVKLQVDSHFYDPDSQTAFVGVTQTFKLWFTPLPGRPAKLLVRLTLEERSNKHYIIQQEDFYEPEDLAYLVWPPLGFVIRMAKFGASAASNAGAWAVQNTLGWWKPKYGPLHKE